MAPVRDLIRLDLLAAGGQLPPVSTLSKLPIVNALFKHLMQEELGLSNK